MLKEEVKVMDRRNRQGQVTAEMAVLFTFVIAAFVFMGFYLQRAGQGGVKSNADSLGQQFSTETPWNSTVTTKSVQVGATTDSDSSTTYSHTVSAQ